MRSVNERPLELRVAESELLWELTTVHHWVGTKTGPGLERYFVQADETPHQLWQVFAQGLACAAGLAVELRPEETGVWLVIRPSEGEAGLTRLDLLYALALSRFAYDFEQLFDEALLVEMDRLEAASGRTSRREVN